MLQNHDDLSNVVTNIVADNDRQKLQKTHVDEIDDAAVTKGVLRTLGSAHVESKPSDLDGVGTSELDRRTYL